MFERNTTKTHYNCEDTKEQLGLKEQLVVANDRKSLTVMQYTKFFSIRRTVKLFWSNRHSIA